MPDPEVKLYVEERLSQEREKSGSSYAVKLVERIVFGILTLFGVAIVMKLIALLNLPS